MPKKVLAGDLQEECYHRMPGFAFVPIPPRCRLAAPRGLPAGAGALTISGYDSSPGDEPRVRLGAAPQIRVRMARRRRPARSPRPQPREEVSLDLIQFNRREAA